MAFTTSGQETEWALFLQPRSPHRAPTKEIMFCASACLSTHLLVHEQTYAKTLQAFFMKPCSIMDYCCGKKLFNFFIDPTKNGQVTAILGFCCNVFHLDHVQYGGAT